MDRTYNGGQLVKKEDFTGNGMKTNRKSGFSLIEIMVGALVLAVLAIGGAAVMYQTGGNIQIQGNKRIAVELANEILEKEKTIDYIKIQTPSKESRSKPVDGIPHTIVITRTKYGDNIADEYKLIKVRVTYTLSGDVVELSTTRSFN